MNLEESNIQTLWDDGVFVLSRVPTREVMKTRLAVSLSASQPSADALALLEKAYGLRARLDSPRFTQPTALVREARRTALIMDDPGGAVLSSVDAHALPLAQVLTLAANMAAALDALHRRELIHNDIRPAHLLVDLKTGSAALTGFGLVSSSAPDGDEISQPVLFADALPYVAPERTGLVNRRADARSDLYSLGIVIYRMLSGKLPFAANSAAEWLHCHTARRPVPLREYVPELPEPLAAIVERLLAKAAEDRYQSARGVEHDLRLCAEQCRLRGRIEPFALGTADTHDRLLIPDRLYGREKEVRALASVFERVARDGSTEFVLVSGYSGIGKSSLVEDFHQAMSWAGGRFASGKFDQFQRDIPYATIAQCMQTVVQQILDEGEPEAGTWRERVQDAVGPLGQLVLDLIPELERAIGPQPDVPQLPPQEAQTRFVAVLTRFIGAFARPEQPLVLFLDDLQWLDSGTASVLEALAKGPGVKHLMLIGAWRDNEVGPTHPLTRVVAAIRAGQVRVHELLLAPLGVSEVARLVRDATHGVAEQTAEHTAALAQVVFDKTGGNPFFVVQFLQILADEGYLTFDPARREWTWNADRIAKRGFPDSVVDLMVDKLGRLSESTRQALADFACLGASVSTSALARVSGQSAEAVDAALAEAAVQGIVYRRADGYAFVHDRIQEAAYALIAEAARAASHLRIGTMLDGGDGDPALERNIFEVVSQYNRALHVIDDSRVRMRVAALNLRAGRRARASAAYGSALAYLSVGSDILGSGAWQTHYGEKFSLELLRAECEFLTGNAVLADERLRDLAERANTISDRAAVAFLRVTLHTALDQMQAAVDICLDYLRHVGIEWVAHPAREAAKAEYASLLGRLRQRPIESLIELPLLENETLEATLNVLTAVLPPAFFTDENLVCLVLARMANLSIEHGNADASSLGFAYLGMVAGPIFGDYRAGFEFGRLGLALVDERNLARFRARVYMCFAYHVMPWTQPMHAGLPLLRRAFEAAQQSGDLTYTGFSSCCLVTSLLAAGEPLAEVEDQAVDRLRIVRAAGFGLIVDIMTAQLSLIRGLRGLSPWLGSAEADHADERSLEQHLEGNPALAIAACWYWIRKQEAQYFAGDMAGALMSGERAAPLLWTSSGHFELAEYHFFSALTRLQCHDTLAPDQQAANEAALAEHIEKLHGWAGHGPANFASRAALVDAERARTQAREFDAMRLYERAIEHAREQRLRHIEGLANELAARFYLEHGFASIGMIYLRNARQAYLNWGSMAKVRSLDTRHPELAAQVAQAAQAAGGAPHGPVANQLDAETVVRASQAISSERVLERLMHTLMSIVLEHAGARRAVLILPHAEQLCIEAEASAVREGSTVQVGRRAGSSEAVPLAMLHHSLRTHEAVLVDDASIDNPFAADEYFIGRRARSVLCLPLVKQTRLIGALYLENELAPGVFTPSRMAVLKLLASQAAISIENASLEKIEALLEEKEALLHEVHHRVKNNLQLISSLLSLQAARVGDASVAELFLDSRNRVRSMAMVHENLYRAGNFARIDMEPHIRNLCAHLSRAYELSRLDVSLDVLVDDVQLDMNRAVACGMIVNELVTNALKHAFPQGRSGRLRVELVSNGERECRLSVSDDGIGLSPEYSIEQAESLGLQIVSDLSRQLHATIALGRDTGTSFDIHFKL